MVQCSETKAMARETTGTEPEKVGRGPRYIGPGRQARDSRISLRAMAVVTHALFCFVFLTVE